VKAGFIAVQQRQGRRGGKGVEGDDHLVHHPIHHPAVGLDGHLLIEHAGFERPGAALAPVRGAHFFDHAELDFVGGLEAVDVLLQENQEILARFAFHDHTFGAKAVTDSVQRGVTLPGWSGRPFRAGAVGFRRLNSSQ
jgi:hypothetical protein